MSEEEEATFWEKKLLGTTSAKSLLNTIYFYNGKIFGLRGGDHRKIVVNNFEIGPNFIKFEENASKTYHGGICDLKYVPRKVKHVCHSIGEKHEPSRCLLEIYTLYIGLVETHAKAVTAFYFKPSTRRLAFEKVPVGINSLNKILPEMCESAGFKRKTAHSLRVTCVSSLFNAGVDEKLIRERSGHRSNALFQYEKPTEENVSKVSNILGRLTLRFAHGIYSPELLSRPSKATKRRLYRFRYVVYCAMLNLINTQLFLNVILVLLKINCKIVDTYESTKNLPSLFINGILNYELLWH